MGLMKKGFSSNVGIFVYIACFAQQKALVIGRSYLPLANAALDTLEHWSCSAMASVIKPHFADMLPLLDAYIKSNSGKKLTHSRDLVD